MSRRTAATHVPGRELLEACIDALDAQGLGVSRIWPGAAARQLAIDRLGRLLELVHVWNARVGLTAARGTRELVDLYLVDALVVAARGARDAAMRGDRWLDVGSGGGAPGLVLSVLVPELDLTLCEPRAKRVAFLRSALGSLGLASTRVVDARSSQLPPGGYDVAMSRATFSPDAWLAEGARLSRREVWVFLARGAEPKLAGWRAALDLAYTWPLTGGARRALVYRRETPGTRPA